jgi:hypothetical protein
VKNRSYESVIIAYIIVISNARITHSFRMHFGGQNATKTSPTCICNFKNFPGGDSPGPPFKGEGKGWGEEGGKGGVRRGKREGRESGEGGKHKMGTEGEEGKEGKGWGKGGASMGGELRIPSWGG